MFSLPFSEITKFLPTKLINLKRNINLKKQNNIYVSSINKIKKFFMPLKQSESNEKIIIPSFPQSLNRTVER